MPYATAQYTGDGSTTLFAVTFPFVSRDHVHVTVAGNVVTPTWLTDGLLALTPAPAMGALVSLMRDTSRATRLVDFQDAALLTEVDLDLANTQALYVAQEAFDASDVAAVQTIATVSAAAAQGSATAAASSAAVAVTSAASATASASAASASAALAASLSNFPVPIASGGTGQTTAQAALNSITSVGAASAGQALMKVGTNAVWGNPLSTLAPGLDFWFFRGDGVFTNTLNGSMRLSIPGSGDASFWTSPGNATDEKHWAWRLSAPSSLNLWAYNDSENAGANSLAIGFTRTGAAVTTASIGGRVLVGGATDDLSQKLQVGGGVRITGNLGVGGAAPASWTLPAITANSGYGALTSSGVGGSVLLTRNAYYQSGTWRYVATDNASLIELTSNSSCVWYKAGSGTAGAAISLTTTMALDQNGVLLIGGGQTSGNASSGKLSVFDSQGSGGLGTVVFANPAADATGNRMRIRIAPTLSFATTSAGLNVSPYVESGVETSVTDAAYVSFGVYTGLALTEAARFQSSGNFAHKYAICDQGYITQTPLTGASFTVGASSSTVLIRPAGTIATLTITMPAAPVDGQIVRFASSQTVTSCTINANTGQSLTGAPGTLSPTAPCSFIYNLANTAWMRIH